MAILKSFCIALSTYSAIPVPQFDWDEGSMAYSFCFLPAVGAIIALALWLWLTLSRFLGFCAALCAAVSATIPIAVTGGIHMDGFCDCVDALSSHQEPERCLEIMKDSRAGAFAVIFCGIYFLLNFGLMSEAPRFGMSWLAIFVISRAASALSVTSHKNARGEGMLAAFQKPSHAAAVKRASWCWLAVGALCMDLCNIWASTAALVFCVAAWHFYHRTALKRFGGITGDTSGFFVQILELAMLAGYILGAAIARKCGM